MKRSYDTLDELFESAILTTDDVNSVVADDEEDNLLGYLEENRKISIFDDEYILEGEQ